MKDEKTSLLTKRLLRACTAVKIKAVTIRCTHKRVPQSLSLPAHAALDSVVAAGNAKVNGWPALWAALEKVGLRGGCGNGNQMQVRSDADLTDGFYEIIDGAWVRTWWPVTEDHDRSICAQCGKVRSNHTGSIVGGVYWCATAGHQRYVNSGRLSLPASARRLKLSDREWLLLDCEQMQLQTNTRKASK